MIIITDEAQLQTLFDLALEKALPKMLMTGKKQVEIIEGKTLIERLIISEPTLIRWRQKGKIPYLTIGSAIRYDWFKVLEAIEKNPNR